MQRLATLAATATLLLACDRPTDNSISTSASSVRPTVPPVDVQTFGELHKVMHEGQTSGVYTIRDALAKPHAFAVGALSELRGEVTIRDGVAWLGYPDGREARVVQEVPEREEATLFVVSHVERWQSLPVAASVPLAELDRYIESHAAAAGIDVEKPFPVRIEGAMVSVDWHVIDGTRLTPGGSHEDHKRAAVTGKLTNVDAQLVGFFAQNAQGVFTHMDQRSHFHVIEPRSRVTGHVDDVVVAAGATLMVPARAAE